MTNLIKALLSTMLIGMHSATKIVFSIWFTAIFHVKQTSAKIAKTFFYIIEFFSHAIIHLKMHQFAAI